MLKNNEKKITKEKDSVVAKSNLFLPQHQSDIRVRRVYSDLIIKSQALADTLALGLIFKQFLKYVPLGMDVFVTHLHRMF